MFNVNAPKLFLPCSKALRVRPRETPVGFTCAPLKGGRMAPKLPVLMANALIGDHNLHMTSPVSREQLLLEMLS